MALVLPAELVLPANFTTVRAGPRSFDVGCEPSVCGDPPFTWEKQHVVRRDDDILVKIRANTAKALMGDDIAAFKAATLALKKACNSKRRRALADVAGAKPKPPDCARLALTGKHQALQAPRAAVVLSSDDSGDDGSSSSDVEDDAHLSSPEAASPPQDGGTVKDAIIEELRKELAAARLAADAVAQANAEAKAAKAQAADTEALLEKERQAAQERENQAASMNNILVDAAVKGRLRKGKLREVLELTQDGVIGRYNLRNRS